jgi:hypothetical protein
MRGRTAFYGRSHLAQLVAIKRLQADGLTVAAVQERLLGADGSAVEEIALLPADLSGLVAQVEASDEPQATDAVTATAAATRKRFWVTPTTPPLEHDAHAALATHEASEPTTHDEPAPTILGIRLTRDVTLLLPPGREPDAAARVAIAEAAQPLLDLLNQLGLSDS